MPAAELVPGDIVEVAGQLAERHMQLAGSHISLSVLPWPDSDSECSWPPWQKCATISQSLCSAAAWHLIVYKGKPMSVQHHQQC